MTSFFPNGTRQTPGAFPLVPLMHRWFLFWGAIVGLYVCLAFVGVASVCFVFDRAIPF
jgi:hypothetical protein